MATKTPDLAAHVATLAIRSELREVRPSGAAALSKAEKRELLTDARVGKVVELEADAVVFAQTKTERPLPWAKRKEANANFSAFAPEELGAFAKSFRGCQFLRDHDHGLMAVGGEITASALVETDTHYEIHQTLRMTAQWAVVAALEGNLRTFSIGWETNGQRFYEALHCSVCGDRMYRSDCSHFPGDRAEVELQGKKHTLLVESVWRSVRGKECSGVAFPAVRKGTGIDEIRSLLAEHRADMTPKAREVETMADEKMAAQLAEIEKRQAALGADLAAERDLREAAEAKLAEERKIREDAEKAQRADEVHKTRARLLDGGLMVHGDKRDVYFAKLAKRDSLDDLHEWVETLERIVPVGVDMQSDPGRTAAPAEGDDEVTKLMRDEYREPAAVAAALPSTLKALGLSEEDFIAHGQHNYWRKAN